MNTNVNDSFIKANPPRLNELSKISNAILTPHLNCDLSLITHKDGEAIYHNVGKVSKYEKGFRVRWCERQLKTIGLNGAVICG